MTFDSLGMYKSGKWTNTYAISRTFVKRCLWLLLKRSLQIMGIIETPTCTFPVEDMNKPKEQIMELMAHSGEYQ